MSPKTANDALQRAIALKALREQIYLKHPATYGAADFTDDIPQINPYGFLFSDVAPSLALMDRNKDARRQQVEEAKTKVRSLGKQDSSLLSPLGKETVHSAGKMMAGSIPLTLAFSLLPKLLKYRGKVMQPRVARPLAAHVAKDVATNAAFAGAIGGSVPILTNKFYPDEKQLDEAGDILTKHPYSSSLPFMDSIMPSEYGKDPSYLRGAGVGALAGGMTTGKVLGAKNLFQKAWATATKSKYRGDKMIIPTILGAAGGAGLGILNTAIQKNDNRTQERPGTV